MSGRDYSKINLKMTVKGGSVNHLQPTLFLWSTDAFQKFFEGWDGPSAFQVGPRDASLAPSRASHRAHYTVRVHVPLVVGDTALSEANDRVRFEQTRVGGPSAFRPRHLER